jgi:hypothetical protein
MKRLIIFSGLLLFMATILGGCYKDVLLPEVAADPDGPPQQVSFKVELEPMFKEKCTNAGCHVPGSHKPYLDKIGESYYQIVNGGYVNTAIPKASILHVMLNTEMREYMPSASDRQKVYDWIRNGAPNN